ncbi:MAG: hypothetical protein K6G16_08750 [Lachnospiraceae bacterium]|nr:hypothetical protein [Lachnospiraceae bacterium]
MSRIFDRENGQKSDPATDRRYEEVLAFSLSHGAVIGRGARDREIRRTDSDIAARLLMKGIVVPAIPEDYRAFLRRADGFSRDDVCFFGTELLLYPAGGSLPSLMEVNYRNRPNARGVSGCLVIGACGDDTIVYDGDAEEYRFMDPGTAADAERRRVRSWRRFDDLFFCLTEDTEGREHGNG